MPAYQSQKMNNLTNNESVVSYSPEDYLLPMFELSTAQLLNRLICAIFGIPLNLLVLALIIRSRLWSSRNIFRLGVTFFNLIALLQAVIELVLVYLYHRGDGSHKVLSIIDTEQNELLLCIFLSNFPGLVPLLFNDCRMPLR